MQKTKRDTSSILGSWRSPGGGHGNPLQYTGLKTPMDKGAWWATVHRVTKSQTWLKQLSTAQHSICLMHWGATMLGTCIFICNCLIFFLDWSLDHYIVSVLVSCNGVYFKVRFIWYKYCYFCFFLISICLRICFRPLTFSLHVCLGLRSVSYRQHI